MVGKSFDECTARSMATREQRLLDFFGEQPLAAGVGERPILDHVAGCADDIDLDPPGIDMAAAARRLCTSRA